MTDLILVNAKENPQAQAMAIHDCRLLLAGTEQEVRAAMLGEPASDAGSARKERHS